MADFEEKTLEIKLQAAGHHQTRIRIVVWAMAIISAMLLTTTYNAYLSYDRSWSLLVAHRDLAKKTAANVLTEQALRSWADARSVQTSLLGVRVNVDDAPILGTVALAALGLWLCSLVGRESAIVIGLLRKYVDPIASKPAGAEISRSEWSRAVYVINALCANAIFADHRTTSPERDEVESSGDVSDSNSFKVMRTLLVWLPASACLMMFLFDRLSYFQPSAFDAAVAAPTSIETFYNPSGFLFALGWLVLAVFSGRTHRFLAATQSRLFTSARKLSDREAEVTGSSRA